MNRARAAVCAAALIAVIGVGPAQGQPTQSPVAVDASTAQDAPADFPGSWELPGTGLRMKIGGYLKADFLYDFDGTLDNKQFLMSTIPVEGEAAYGNEGYVSFFANETRFNIDVRRTEEQPFPLTMFMEVDFFSPDNQLRLRHAYVEAGHFTIGQTWTTLTMLEAIPTMIDFAAGDALLGGRTTQVRYRKPMSDRWTLAIGAEMQNFLGIDNPHALSGKPNLRLPLLALRADYRARRHALFLGSSVAQLRWDAQGTAPSAAAAQWHVVVAGRQQVTDQTTITEHVSFGKGAGENVMAFAGSRANAVLEADGTLTTMPVQAVVLGVIHQWNAELTTNASVAYGWLDAPESRSSLALKDGGIAHVNLLWTPVPQFRTGVEYMWGAKRAANDAFGRGSRIQFGTYFFF